MAVRGLACGPLPEEVLARTYRRPSNGPARTARLCERLLARWEPMFSRSVDPTRARRTEAILRSVGARFHGPFRVLELGSGPGPLVARMLRRFPSCRIVAVDTDPVLLEVATEALRRFARRTTWLLADLRGRRWSAGLPAHDFDVIASSLTLHWLEESELRRVYRDVRRLLRPGGLVINGDFLPSSPGRGQRLDRGRAGEGSRSSGTGGARVRAFKAEWERWWSSLERLPSMDAALTLRQVRLPGPWPPRRTTGPRTPVSLESHERALQDAGFRETRVIWAQRGFRVLVGST
jgi:SAM-dependent methyltransferase